MSRRGQDVRSEDEAAPRRAAVLDDITRAIESHAAEVAEILSQGRIAIVAHQPDAEWAAILRGLGWAGGPLPMARPLALGLAKANPIIRRWMEQGGSPPAKRAVLPALRTDGPHVESGKSSRSGKSYVMAITFGALQALTREAAPDAVIGRIYCITGSGLLLVTVGPESTWVNAGSPEFGG